MLNRLNKQIIISDGIIYKGRYWNTIKTYQSHIREFHG